MSEALPARRNLGRYELIKPLGQGGMGEVFLARLTGAAGFEKPCVIKTVLPSLLEDRQFLERFQHEARVLVHLSHSSIAQVYDMGEADGTLYMALEYVAGVDLATLLDKARDQGRPLPVPMALYIGMRIAEGLGFAHRKRAPDGTPLNIIHRDVSPHNVMVSFEGEVKVIDFGLATSTARSRRYTLPSTVLGKMGYMSPEQARAESVDARTDIYSCGVVLWEMLAGRPLVPLGTISEMMAAMSQPRAPELPPLRKEVSPELDAVVRRALAARPEERYARADDFARALNEQLLRSGSSIGAEEVGVLVRKLCPEGPPPQREPSAFLEQTAMRPASGEAAPPRPRSSPGVPPEDELGTAGTVLRESKPSVAPAAPAAPPAPPPRPVPPQASAKVPQPAQRSNTTRTFLIIMGVLFGLFLLCCFGSTALSLLTGFSNPQQSPPQQPYPQQPYQEQYDESQ